MLIQIVDPDMEFPQPLKDFREVHQFKFLDIEKDGMTNDGSGTMIDMSGFAVTQKDADTLVGLLQKALEKNTNVIVHCHAGICRSGAVAEIGVMLGFQDTEVFRSPNLLVKHKMMKTLGWAYDENEPHSINFKPLEEDWSNDNEKVFMLSEAKRKFRELHEGDI